MKQGAISSACYLLHADFMLGMFFDPEDGGDVFFRDVDIRITRHYVPEDITVHNHCAS
jgi:hypothetical protein